MNRGDVILVRFPHPSGLRGKKRPAVVVQSDDYLDCLNTVVVAQVLGTLSAGMKMELDKCLRISLGIR